MDYKQTYDKWWQAFGDEHSDNCHHPYQFKLVAKILKDCNKVLDVGCGDGLLLKLLPQAVGLDVSKKALEIARKRGIKNEIVVADARKMPFKDNEFDGVAVLDVIEHLYPEDTDKVLSEIKRVAKPKAKIVLITPRPSGIHKFTVMGKVDKEIYDGLHLPLAKITIDDLRSSIVHVKEYKPKELRELLSKYYKIKEHLLVGNVKKHVKLNTKLKIKGHKNFVVAVNEK